MYFQGFVAGTTLMSFFWCFYNAEKWARTRWKYEHEKGIVGTEKSWFQPVASLVAKPGAEEGKP